MEISVAPKTKHHLLVRLALFFLQAGQQEFLIISLPGLFHNFFISYLAGQFFPGPSNNLPLDLHPTKPGRNLLLLMKDTFHIKSKKRRRHLPLFFIFKFGNQIQPELLQRGKPQLLLLEKREFPGQPLLGKFFQVPPQAKDRFKLEMIPHCPLSSFGFSSTGCLR